MTEKRHDRNQAVTNLMGATAFPGEPWLPILYVEVELSDLENYWKPISSPVYLSAEQALELRWFLIDLSQTAVTEQAAQVKSYCLLSPRRRVTDDDID